jgi:hypothetical protein
MRATVGISREVDNPTCFFMASVGMTSPSRSHVRGFLFERYFVRWDVQRPIPSAASPKKAALPVQAGDPLCLRRDRHPRAIAPAPKANARMGTRIMMRIIVGWADEASRATRRSERQFAGRDQ